MQKILDYIEQHPLKVVIAIIVISLICFLPIRNLKLNTNVKSLIQPNTDTQEIASSVLDTKGEYTQDYTFVLQGDGVYTAETFNELEKVLSDLAQYDELNTPVSVFDYLTVKKKGTRLAVTKLSSHVNGTPWTDEEVKEVEQNIKNDDIAKDLLASKDGNALLFYFNNKKLGSNQERLIGEWDNIIHQLDPYCDVYIIGAPVFDQQVEYYLFRDFVLLLGLCVIVILLIYFFSFKSFRAIIIPGVVSLIGLIWTMAFMSIIGYELSVVTMITPCMVLILGSSYSIHMLNEYYQIKGKNKTNKADIMYAASKIKSTILTASITTVIGFLSLLVSKLDAFRELSISVSFGIALCAFLSITFIPALLLIQRKPSSKKVSRYQTGVLNKISLSLGKIVSKFWYIFVIIFILSIGMFFVVHDKIETVTDYLAYFPQKDPLVVNSKVFVKDFGGTEPFYITFRAPDGSENYFDDPQTLSKIYAFEEAIKNNDPDIVSIFSISQYVAFLNKQYSGESEIPNSKGMIIFMSKMLDLVRNQIDSYLFDTLISEDGNSITLSIRYYDSVLDSLQSVGSAERIIDNIESYKNLLPSDIEYLNWGGKINLSKANNAIRRDQNLANIVSFFLVFFTVLIFFKSVSFSLYSLIPILFGVTANYIFMYFTGIPFDMVTSVFGSITVGVGIDDALHYLIRYNNTKKAHPNISMNDLVSKTLTKTGKPIIITSLSIICGMLVLTLASYSPIRYFGILLSLALVNTTLATLFILPSFMILVSKISRKPKIKY
ncbi:MAG: efflux RND transporter permease subunit [Pleomorphochaeta sp.]